MNNRRLLTTLTGGVAIALAVISIAWACGSPQIIDMKLANKNAVTYNSGTDVGTNTSFCALARQATNGCGREVTVTGTNFANDNGDPLTSVKMFWLDEPYFATGAGRTHIDQQALAGVIETFGVQLTTTPSTVSVSGNGFTTEVVVPPTATTYYDDGLLPPPVPRPVGTYPGANAICALWEHDVAPTGPSSSDHKAAICNQYNMLF